MSSKIYSVTIDCNEPRRLAGFWKEILAYEITYDSDEEVVIEAKEGPGSPLLFIKVPDAKVVKNRIHLDLNPENQDAEVARALELGATKVDIGQGDETWVVLADPEGNEFCILTAKD